MSFLRITLATVSILLSVNVNAALLYGSGLASLWTVDTATGALNLVNETTISTGADIHMNSLAFAPSPVPLPAAAWLFGSGLIGLVGFARRKKA